MMRSALIILILSFFSVSGYSQAKSFTLTYNPPTGKNGFQASIPFIYAFRNCYGEVSVLISKQASKATASSYVYEGQTYTSSDIGSAMFNKVSIGLTDISADVYLGSTRLGRINMGNVIEWDVAGCFGQTYHAMGLLGLEDAPYRDKTDELSLQNVRLESCSANSYKVEGKIKEVATNRSYDNAISEGDRLVASGRYEEAKAKYREASSLKYNEPYPKDKIKEVDDLLKKKKNKEAADKKVKLGDELKDKGDYEGAKRKYQEAKRMDPDNGSIDSKLSDINNKLSEEARKKGDAVAQKNKTNTAKSKAANQRHKGTVWGSNHRSASYGSNTQNAVLMGDFRVDYDIWTAAGEPVYRLKFYWQWSTFQYTDYPLYVSVLSDTVVQIAKLKKYPDLMNRWNRIRPEYIEIESDILYYKMGEEFVADVGTIHFVPEVIGYANQELVQYSLPGSPSWDELFPYCNGLEWGYFRDLGLYEEIDEYSDKFGNDISWPRFTFMYSDVINLFIDDYTKKSSSLEVTKIKWPTKRISAIVAEYLRREKEEKEKDLSSEDFWNSPENGNTTNTDDFWNTPENNTTTREQQFYNKLKALGKELSKSISRKKEEKKKYQALLNPFTISNPIPNTVTEEGEIDVTGSVNSYFTSKGNKISIQVEDRITNARINSSNFSGTILLAEGWNPISLTLKGIGYEIKNEFKLFYKKPPPLPCDEQTNAGGSGQTINEHGLGTTSGTFYVDYDMYNAPDEMIIYAGPKERRSTKKILFQTYGNVSGSDRIRVAFSNIDSGIITVEVNGSSGTSWEYVVECPN